MGRTARRMGGVIALLLVGSAALAQGVDYRSPENLARLIEGQTVPYLLLDVRTPMEYAGGHIPTAANIPFDQVAERIGSLSKGALVIVYCASGRRSSIAGRTLTELGFTNVVDFGAVSNWSESLETGGP